MVTDALCITFGTTLVISFLHNVQMVERFALSSSSECNKKIRPGRQDFGSTRHVWPYNRTCYVRSKSYLKGGGRMFKRCGRRVTAGRKAKCRSRVVFAPSAPCNARLCVTCQSSNESHPSRHLVQQTSTRFWRPSPFNWQRQSS